MADSVSSVAEEAEVQTVTGGPTEARSKSRHAAAAWRNGARVRDDPVAFQDLASTLTHRREGKTVHGHT